MANLLAGGGKQLLWVLCSVRRKATRDQEAPHPPFTALPTHPHPPPPAPTHPHPPLPTLNRRRAATPVFPARSSWRRRRRGAPRTRSACRASRSAWRWPSRPGVVPLRVAMWAMARPCGCGCQNRFGIPFWLVGEFTTQFRTYFSGDRDVHWGYGLLTHGHVGFFGKKAFDPCHFVSFFCAFLVHRIIAFPSPIVVRPSRKRPAHCQACQSCSFTTGYLYIYIHMHIYTCIYICIHAYISIM